MAWYGLNIWGSKPIVRGLLQQHHEYLRRLAQISGAVVKETANESGWYLVKDQNSTVAITVDLLVADQSRRTRWLDAIQAFQKSAIALSEGD